MDTLIELHIGDLVNQAIKDLEKKTTDTVLLPYQKRVTILGTLLSQALRADE